MDLHPSKRETLVQVEDLLTRECRYDEIRGLYVMQLVDIWVEDRTGAMHTRIKKKINSFIEGDLEYAIEMVSASSRKQFFSKVGKSIKV